MNMIFATDYRYKDDLLSSEFGRLVEAMSRDIGRESLDNNMVYSPERMDALFQQLVTPGVQAMLGVKLVMAESG